MALFTDGPVSDQEDLRQYESGILEVSAAEQIEINSKLLVAQREVGFELVTCLMRHGPEYLDQDHGLTHVVVNDALRHWHAVHSLSVIYRDAYFHHLNDRFKEKWAQYSRLTKTAKEMYFDAGVAVVAHPIPRAKAPLCTVVGGSPSPTRIYYVSITWHGKGRTGAPSNPTAIELKTGGNLRVHPSEIPSDVDGWSVYVGVAADSLWKQNIAPISNDDVWLQADVVGVGEGPGIGQAPTAYVRACLLLQRG